MPTLKPDSRCGVCPETWSSWTPNRRADRQPSTLPWDTVSHSSRIKLAITASKFTRFKNEKKKRHFASHMVDFPIIFIFVHSCHIDSLSFSPGTRGYCSIASEWKHAGTQPVETMLGCVELWTGKCWLPPCSFGLSKAVVLKHFHVTEPWIDKH